MEDSKRMSRRRHAPELKQQVLEACAQPGASVAQVALTHGLNARLKRTRRSIRWNCSTRRTWPDFSSGTMSRCWRSRRCCMRSGRKARMRCSWCWIAGIYEAFGWAGPMTPPAGGCLLVRQRGHPDVRSLKRCGLQHDFPWEWAACAPHFHRISTALSRDGLGYCAYHQCYHKKKEAQQWQDAQHQFVGTIPQPRGRPALHAVPAMAVTAAATAAATVRPTRRAAGAATAAVTGPAEAPVQGRAGRAPVRLSRTRLLRWRPSRRSARLLKEKRRRSQAFGIASSATLGMTGREPPGNCTICSKRLVSRFGSARRTLALACR